MNPTEDALRTSRYVLRSTGYALKQNAIHVRDLRQQLEASLALIKSSRELLSGEKPRPPEAFANLALALASGR